MFSILCKTFCKTGWLSENENRKFLKRKNLILVFWKPHQNHILDIFISVQPTNVNNHSQLGFSIYFTSTFKSFCRTNAFKIGHNELHRTKHEYGTWVLYGMPYSLVRLRYGTESLNIRTVLSFMLLIKTKKLNAFFCRWPCKN